MRLLRLAIALLLLVVNMSLWSGCGQDPRVKQPAPEATTNPEKLGEMLPPPSQP